MNIVLHGRRFVGAVSAAVALLLLAGGALAQTPTTAQLKQLEASTKYQQWLYFYQQRAFPNGHLPPGAYQAARKDFIRKFGAAPGAAGAPPTPSINATGWQSIGPSPIANGQTSPDSVSVSGRINAIAIDPTNSNNIYIGAAQGGVWKTTNGGTSWVPLTDAQCSLAMGGLAIDPVNPSIVYAGTGEQNFSLDSYYGCGVLRSADGGQTWTQLGASSFVNPSGGGATISRVLVDPTTAGSTSTTTVLVAADSGVWRSTDSGATWTNKLAGVATDLVRDPSTPATLYAALGYLFGSAANGVYKSTDGGQSWTQQTGGGFPTSNVGRINLAIAASSPSNLYAAVQSTSPFGALLGIWHTDNGGAGWSQLTTNANCSAGGGNQCWYDLYIAVDPTNPSIVYLGTEDIYRSTDGGDTFTDIGGYGGGDTHPDQHALVFDPNTHTTIYIGNDGGIFKNTNPGTSVFSSLNANLTITQFGAGISMTPDSSQVLGGTQDNGTDLFNGSDVWTQVQGGDGGFTSIDFNTPTTAYHEFTGPSPEKTTNLGTSPVWTDISSGIQEASGSLFYTPFVMSPSNSSTLYLGTDILNRTTNGGGSWSAISTNMTGNVSAIAEAKSNSQVIWYGTDQGDVEVSTNGGTGFTSVSTGLPGRYVTYIAVDPTNASNAFVTVSGFGTGHVFATTNSGTSWTDIDSNLPDIPVNAIVLDPTAPTANIYIGTDLGVFHTTNGGASWSPFQTGLPDVAVVDLVYNSTTGVLLAATHGRGVWKGTSACAALHDFNGDCKADIVWQNTASPFDTWLWLMNGPSLTGASPLGNIPASYSVSVGDFNGDGKADLLFNDPGTGDTWMALNTGSGFNWTHIGVSAGYRAAGVGDFDGDRKADIVWQNTASPFDTWVWLMNGPTLAHFAKLGTVPTSYSTSVGDFNGDGKADILVNNPITADTWMVVSVDGQSFNWTHIGVNAGYRVAGVGDFDGDVAHTADIVWQNTASPFDTWVWLMNGPTLTGFAGLGDVPASYAALIGDFTGDGKADILWNNVTSGDTWMALSIDGSNFNWSHIPGVPAGYSPH